MEIVLGIVVGVVIALLAVYLYIRSVVVRVMDDLGKHIDRVAETLMPVTIERENGVLFCYNQEDHQFICQGATMQDIRVAFKARYPEKTAYLAGGDESLLEELRAELTKLKVSDQENILNPRVE